MALGFFPDAPESTPDVLVDLDAIPTARGYGGAPSPVSSGYDPLASACTGAALLTRLDGNQRLFAGTQTKIYEGSGMIWTDVSRAGSYVTGDVKWRFSQFGNTSLAVSKAIQLQYSNAGAFANVANAPKAAIIVAVKGFIILLDIDDTGTGLLTGFGDSPDRWWCSAYNAPLFSWAPSAASQATTGRLVSAPGPLTAGHELGDTCVAFKKKAMYVGQFTGDQSVWRWDLVPGEVGVANNECVASTGTALLFIGNDDIYSFDGSRPVSIGGGIKEWFFARLNKTYAYKIEAQHDSINGCVWWYYPSAGSTTLDSAIIYNYKTGKWGATTRAIECAVTTVNGAITYGTLGDLFATYADIPEIAYDSPFWQAGAPVLGIIDTAHTLNTLTGVPGPSYVVTGYMGDDQRVTFCDQVRPRYGQRPTTATLTPRGVMALGDVAVAGAARAINGNRFDVMQSWRWHGFRMDFSGTWELQAVLPRLIGEGDE